MKPRRLCFEPSTLAQAPTIPAPPTRDYDTSTPCPPAQPHAPHSLSPSRPHSTRPRLPTRPQSPLRRLRTPTRLDALPRASPQQPSQCRPNPPPNRPQAPAARTKRAPAAAALAHPQAAVATAESAWEPRGPRRSAPSGTSQAQLRCARYASTRRRRTCCC